MLVVHRSHGFMSSQPDRAGTLSSALCLINTRVTRGHSGRTPEQRHKPPEFIDV